jgi:hypothetical protein
MDPKGQAGSEKVSRDTFAAQRQEIVKEQRSKEDSGGGAMLGALRMFAAIASMNPDEEQAQKDRERLMFATPGIIRPEGWEQLPMEERKRRTVAAIEASK